MEPPRKFSDEKNDAAGGWRSTVPKEKNRNPIGDLAAIYVPNCEAKDVNPKVIQLIQSFNYMKNSFSLFLAEVVKHNDEKGFSNQEVIDAILAVNSKAKEWVRGDMQDIPGSLKASGALSPALLNSFKINETGQNKEAAVRMLGHFCFENHIQSPEILEDIF
jgi:hypothetical protein